MSVRTLPLEIGPDSGEIDGVPKSISVSRVLEALQGRDRQVSVSQALGLVAGSDLPDKVQLLTHVLRNSQIAPGARRRAAILLARTDVTQSQPLIEMLRDKDPRVQSGAAEGLTWIGGAEAYQPLIAAMRSTSSVLATQYQWAARVVAHRNGLAASELPPLPLTAQIELASDRHAIRIAAARPERLRLCLNTIAKRSFRLRFDRSAAYEVHCNDSEWILLFTEDAVRDPGSLLRRRSIPAAAALFITEVQSFSIALIVLLEPSTASSGRLLVCRSTGKLMFAGQVRLNNGPAEFSLRALRRAGAYPLIFDGSIRGNQLSITEAVSGIVVVPKLQPKRMF